MNYKANYEALTMLVKDPRVPRDIVIERTGICEEGLLQVVQDTGLKHYRLLDMLPPSEVVDDPAMEEYGLETASDLYEMLWDRKLVEDVVRGNTYVAGIIPSDRLTPALLSVPCYGKHWYAFHVPTLVNILGRK